MPQVYDVIVIGAGPGGYVAAIKASQLGLKTALVEKDNPGGVCLNWGCIPTKSLLKSAELANKLSHSKDYGINVDKFDIDFTKVISRSRAAAKRMSKGVDYLIKHNKIDIYFGSGKISEKGVVTVSKEGKVIETLSCKNVIIATGGRPRPLPGTDFDGTHIISSKEAMSLESIPKDMVILGGGAIGVEFAYFYSNMGTKVTIVEMLPQLMPNEDQEVAAVLEKSFTKQKIKVMTGASVNKTKVIKESVDVQIVTEKETLTLTTEKLLVAIGIKPNIENLGLEELGVEMDRGFIKVDENYKTNIDGIFAVGDCNGGELLAHVASAEAVNCVESIAGKEVTPIDYSSIPHCTYCQPQVASIGMTEKMAKEKGLDVHIGRYPFRANGKAVASGDTDGFVKLIFDAKYSDILGAHIVGADATEILGEIGIAKSMGATYMELHKTVHAHPTISEAIMEAAGEAFGEAIHI